MDKTTASASHEPIQVRQILDLVTHMIVALDREGRVTMMNRAGCRILGYAENELVGKDWFATCLPAGIGDEIRSRFRQVIAGQNPISETYQSAIVTRGGEERLIAWHNAVLTDDGGRIVGTMSHGDDISERIREESTWRAEKDLLRAIIDGTDDEISVKDVEGRYVLMNAAEARSHGRPIESLIGVTDRELFPLEDVQHIRSLDLRVIQTATALAYEQEFPPSHGTRRTYSIKKHPLRDSTGHVIGIIGISRDVTERKHAESALRQSEQRLRTLIDASPYCIHELNLEGRLLSMNPAGVTMLGLRDESQVSGRAMFEFVGGGDLAQVKQLFVRARNGETCDFEFQTVHDRIFQSSFVPIRDGSGSVVKLMGLTLDITERKQAEKALAWAEARYRLLFERNLAGVFQSTVDGRILACNPAFVRLFGYASKEELLALHAADLYPTHGDRSHYLANLRRCRVLQGNEIQLKKKDGSLIWVIENVALAKDPVSGEEIIEGTLVDVTELKAAAEQARQHQAELAHVARVSTMGEMASGLAHELNQPLTAVVNYNQGALRRLRSDANAHQDVVEAIEMASAQAHRAAQIIHRLTTFMQKREPRSCSCDINEAVREVLAFAAPDVREQGITIRLDLAVDLPLILADCIQIQQVILNLVRNGIEAMSEVRAGQRLLQIQTSVVSDAVEVAVRDRGSGLTPEARERLFTPFYTTKPQGMGMGLSISRSIIDTHGGKLWATPNPEGGTTFQCTIPVASGAMADENRSDRLRSG